MIKDLQIEMISIDKIIPYENNAKLHPREQVNQIIDSIKEFGFNDPIAVNEKMVIIEGHGRMLAAQKMGLKEVPCIVLKGLTPAQEKAYMLAHNKLTMNSDFDIELLEEELKSLKNENYDLLMTGFSEEEFKEIFDTEVNSFDKFKYGADENIIGLDKKYIVPPFSVLDAKQGYWKDRKKEWRKIIEDDGTSRNCVIGADFGVSLLDPVLSELIIKWYAPKQKGNNIFDCFAGDTVFGFVSAYQGNNFKGIELRKEQVDFNNSTSPDNAIYICDDGRNILNHIAKETQDLFFSCPPYFDLEVYSNKENDASNQKTYGEFYKILDVAFTNSIKCLKNNRFAVIVLGDVRNKKTGEYYDFAGSVKETFKRNGMKLYNELVLLDPLGTAPLRANKFSTSRKNVKIHQNVLVFYKGDTSKIRKEFYNIQEEYNIESEDE